MKIFKYLIHLSYRKVYEHFLWPIEKIGPPVDANHKYRSGTEIINYDHLLKELKSVYGTNYIVIKNVMLFDDTKEKAG